MGALGNLNAVSHGAHSPAQTRPVARSQKRRLLRQIGLKANDFDGVGAALLDNWARSQAKVQLLDAHFAEHGFLDEKGVPREATRVYFTAVNSARLAVVRLDEHLKARGTRAPSLGDYLAATYGDRDGG